MRRMNFNTIKTGFLCQDSGTDKVLNQSLQFVVFKSAGLLFQEFGCNAAWTGQWTASVGSVGGDNAGVEQLWENGASILMNRLSQFLQHGKLTFIRQPDLA